MASLTLGYLTQIIGDAGLDYIANRASVAYLNFVLEGPLAPMRQFKTTNQLLGWIQRNLPLLQAETVPALQTFSFSELIDWTRVRLVTHIIQQIPGGYMRDGEMVHHEDLALTPWDIAETIDHRPALHPIFGIDFRDQKLPIDVVVNGHPFTHRMTMDVAMGILLFSKTADDVDFEMNMYGAPLEYFVPGESTRYDRYENYATEGDFSIRMIGTDPEARYYFFKTDFLRGIRTGAEWAGVDHHDYWVDLQDMDGHPYTF